MLKESVLYYYEFHSQVVTGNAGVNFFHLGSGIQPAQIAVEFSGLPTFHQICTKIENRGMLGFWANLTTLYLGGFVAVYIAG